MAHQPCISCGRPFFGGTSFTYVTWYLGEEQFSFRLRQCPTCASDIRNGVSETGDRRIETGWAMSDVAVELEQLQLIQPNSEVLQGAVNKGKRNGAA